MKRRSDRSKRFLLVGQVALLTLVSGFSQAEEIKPTRTVRSVDMATAGLGGIDTGSGNLSVGGVSGTIKHAFLYWHGYTQEGTYNRATVNFAGQPVTGASLGISGTNCWGSGGSNAFEADVTSLVTGNGSYSLSGLAGSASDHPNGASLVILYNDADTSNDRDVVIYTGNDSNIGAIGYGDPDGWQASLPGINYSGGGVNATLHVADGQQVGSDGTFSFSTADGTAVINDTTALFDGNSVASGGNRRPLADSDTYDVHNFDISSAFTSPGSKTLALNHSVANDCLALVNMTLSFSPGDAPDVGEPGTSATCAEEGYTGTKLLWCRNICEKGYTGKLLDSWIHRWVSRYRDLPYCAVEQDEPEEEQPPQEA